MIKAVADYMVVITNWRFRIEQGDGNLHADVDTFRGNVAFSPLMKSALIKADYGGWPTWILKKA